MVVMRGSGKRGTRRNTREQVRSWRRGEGSSQGLKSRKKLEMPSSTVGLYLLREGVGVRARIVHHTACVV